MEIISNVTQMATYQNISENLMFIMIHDQGHFQYS